MTLKKKLFCAASGAIAGVAPVTALGEDAGFLAAYETITAAELGHHVEVLASDEFEGRDTGTAGETKTINYLKAEFSAAGARPGNGRSYFQDVPLTEIERQDAPSLAFVKGGAAESFVYEDDFVAFAGGASAKVNLRNADVVFVGYGIDAPELGWNDYAGVDVTGKVVVALRGEPNREGDDTFFAGPALTRHGSQPTKYDTAKAHGARAVILVHTEESAGYPWSVMGGISAKQHFIKKAGEPDLDVVMHLNEEATTRLFAAASLNFSDEFDSAAQDGFRAKALPVKVNATYNGALRKIQSKNVIAKFAGAEAPDECVIYTAHWDHVGRNDTLEGDQIFNGAVDNATGTAGLLELAEAYAALPAPPRRSVYFIATTAEEKGLLGADYYADNPICPLENTAAVINLDALFPFGPFTALTVTALGSSEVEDELAAAAKRRGRVLQDDSNPGVGAYYRSDHYPFAKRGVPAVFAVGAPLLEEITEGSDVLARYMDYGQNKYHKVDDEYDAATWDMRGIEGDVRIFFEAGYRIANTSRFPNWRYNNQFRAIRDEMMRGK